MKYITKLGDNFVTVYCECGDFSHTMRFARYDWTNEVSFGPDVDYYVEFMLNKYLPWYKRLWLAFKYVLGLEVIQSNYDTLLLTPDARKEIVELLSMTP